MCLFLFSACSCKDCKNCLTDCIRGCPNPFILIFNLFIAIPLTVVVLIIGGLIPGLARWPMGSWRSICDFWTSICFTLRKGKQAYDGSTANAPSNQHLTGCACCDALIAEVACCFLPIFIVVTPFLPVWLLVMIVIDVLCATIGGACGSCIERFSDWWPLTARQLRRLDEQLARTCHVPGGGPHEYFWPCVEGEEGDMLPQHAPPPTSRPVAPPIARPVPQPYHEPPPRGPPPSQQSAPPPGRGPPPIEQQIAGAALNVASSAASSVARAGLNAVFGGAQGGGARQPQQAHAASQPGAMPRARAVPAAPGAPVVVSSAMPVAQGIPMGRPVNNY